MLTGNPSWDPYLLTAIHAIADAMTNPSNGSFRLPIQPVNGSARSRHGRLNIAHHFESSTVQRISVRGHPLAQAFDDTLVVNILQAADRAVGVRGVLDTRCG